MNQNINYTNPKFADISIDEFDSLNEPHTFSKRYKKNKKKMLCHYRKELLSSSKHRSLRVAAALIIIATPLVTNAATKGDFFNRIWGTLGHKNIASHNEIIQDEEKDPFRVTYPKREYENVDPDTAQKLIGDNLFTKPIKKNIGDTRLTIISAVSDGNVAVVEFSLHRDGGVNCLNYSQLDNESKGAWFAEESSTFQFLFQNCSENIYVDLEKSTDDTLYCYDYIAKDVFGKEKNELTLKITQYPCTIQEYQDNFPDTEDENVLDAYTAQQKIETLTIPLQKEVEKNTFVNADGGTAVFSSLGLKIDMKKGLGLSEAESNDPYSLYYIALNYKNGSTYVVADSARDGIHNCPEEIDNSSYCCEDLDGNMIFVFNRLVDSSQVKSITVNESIYSAN